MHLAHTGFNGGATDGRFGDLVHATISTVSDASCTVLGGLLICRLSAEYCGRVEPIQCQSAGDDLQNLLEVSPPSPNRCDLP